MENGTNNQTTTNVETANTSKFVASVIGLLKGDNAEQTAVKIQSQMSLGFDMQLALKDGERADLADRVDQAEQAVARALANNGKPVSNRSATIGEYFAAKDALETAKEDLAQVDKEIKWLEEGKAEVNS